MVVFAPNSVQSAHPSVPQQEEGRRQGEQLALGGRATRCGGKGLMGWGLTEQEVVVNSRVSLGLDVVGKVRPWTLPAGALA